jgi:hypothetical protein
LPAKAPSKLVDDLSEGKRYEWHERVQFKLRNGFVRVTSEIWRWDATDITAHIRLRTITSSDAVRSCLDRIAEVNPHRNAIVHMVADNALREAKEADAAFTIGGVLRELGASGATILLAEQNMHFCLRIAEEALVIDKGKVVHRQDTAGLPRMKISGAAILQCRSFCQFIADSPKRSLKSSAH